MRGITWRNRRGIRHRTLVQSNLEHHTVRNHTTSPRQPLQGLAIKLAFLHVHSFGLSPDSTTLFCPADGRTTTSRDIYKDPNDEAGAEAEREQEGETLPVVACVINDRLDNVGSDHGGCAVGETEETEELNSDVSVRRYEVWARQQFTMLS